MGLPRCRPGEELGSELEADSGREWLRAEGRSQGRARGEGGVSGFCGSSGGVAGMRAELRETREGPREPQ